MILRLCLVSIVALCGAVLWQRSVIVDRNAAASRLIATVEMLEREIAQAQEAEAVARALARRTATAVAQYAEIRNDLVGGGADDPAPGVVLGALERLRARN